MRNYQHIYWYHLGYFPSSRLQSLNSKLKKNGDSTYTWNLVQKWSEFLLQFQNTVFIFNALIWDFACCMMSTLAFVVENKTSVWYAVTPGWTFKISKVWKMRCHNAATRKLSGVILMSYEILNTYAWFCAIIDTILLQHMLFSGQIRYSNIKPWTSSYSIPSNADTQRAVPGGSGAWTSWYWSMPGNAALRLPSIFRNRAMQNWFRSQFLWRWSLWCSTNTCGQISFITFWRFICITVLSHFTCHLGTTTLLIWDNYGYQTRKQYSTKFCMLTLKHLLMQFSTLQNAISNLNSIFRLCKKFRLVLNKGADLQ